MKFCLPCIWSVGPPKVIYWGVFSTIRWKLICCTSLLAWDRNLVSVWELSQIMFALGVGRWSEKRVVCYLKNYRFFFSETKFFFQIFLIAFITLKINPDLKKYLMLGRKPGFRGPFMLKVRDFQKKIVIIYRLKQICHFTILNSSFEFSHIFCQYAGLWLAAIHHNQM